MTTGGTIPIVPPVARARGEDGVVGATGWLAAGTGFLGMGVLSTFVPLVNAEASLLVLSAAAPRPVGLIAAVGLAVGQTAGKVFVFRTVRRRRWARLPWWERRWRPLSGHTVDGPGERAAAGGDGAGGNDGSGGAGAARWRVQAWLKAWSVRAMDQMDRPATAACIVLASASVGFPPLAATSIAAGARRTPLPLFACCTLAGRLVRFLLMAWCGITLLNH